MAWNPKSLYTQTNCVHYLVKAVAPAVPDSEAVCAWNGPLSNVELDNLSSKAARHLALFGVGIGKLVPFALEKSPWTVVATLAILKTGAAFVPLDPIHPKAWLREILESTKADVVVTSNLFAATFEEMVNIVIISEKTVNANHSGDYICPVIEPSDPVFDFF